MGSELWTTSVFCMSFADRELDKARHRVGT
jgi:hypothetical protein